MAPNVQVPMNFGRHHLSSPTHNNLTLNLTNNRKSRANSLILSFNSPVIERLVATLEITSLDMDDFQEGSVECFVDCLYTGDIEKMDKGTFREVNKMAKVFDVAWLTGRCFGFFNDLVDGMSGSYEDILYLFQEASYVCITLKERGMINLTLAKIGSNTDCKTLFLRKFLEDITDVSASQLDLVVELAGSDLGIVVQSLTGKLKTHLAEQGAVMSDIFRHFLGTSDLRICRTYHKAAFDELFDVLEECSVDDLRWVLALHRRSSEEVKEVPTQSVELAFEPAEKKNLEDSYEHHTKIPDLSDRIELNTSPDQFIFMIATDKDVTSLLSFAETIWRYVDIHQYNFLYSRLAIDIVKIAKKIRNWNSVPHFAVNYHQPREYLKDEFSRFMKGCGAIFDGNIGDGGVACFSKPIQLSLKRNEIPTDIKVPFENRGSYCQEKGRCGLMFKIDPKIVEDTIINIPQHIQLCTDNSLYPDDLHIHPNSIENFRKGKIRLLVSDARGNVLPLHPLYAGPYYDWEDGWEDIEAAIKDTCFLRVGYKLGSYDISQTFR